MGLSVPAAGPKTPCRTLVLAAIGLDILQRHVPRKEDPGVLADLGHIGLDHRLALGLGINGAEMRLGIHIADQFQGAAGIDQVVDDQNSFAIPHQGGVGIVGKLVGQGGLLVEQGAVKGEGLGGLEVAVDGEGVGVTVGASSRIGTGV